MCHIAKHVPRLTDTVSVFVSTEYLKNDIITRLLLDPFIERNNLLLYHNINNVTFDAI